MTFRGGLVLCVLVAGCGGGGSDKVVDAAVRDAAVVDAADVDASAPDAGLAAVQARLTTTLTEMGAFGSKRAGTPAANQASQYIFDKFTALGLEDVRFET